jgi:GNAT superfamily N-acetyltransferase
VPITASTKLAARIDRAELGLLLDLVAVVRAAGGPAQVWPVGGTFAVLGETGSPFNKVSALGFDGPPSVEDLEIVERGYARAGVRVQVELSTLADPSVARLLTARGYQLVGFENILARRLDEVTAAPSAIAVRDVPVAESDLWIETMLHGFLAPDVFDGPESHEAFGGDALRRAYQAFAAVPAVSRQLARVEGEVAGGATMYQRDATAILCGAATLPAWRRRGVQSTLLWQRLAQAREAGCDLAVVTTQPGSKSQENVQRAGFELIYSRAVLVKEH